MGDPALSLWRGSPRFDAHDVAMADVCFGSKGDICAAKGHVCFARKSGHLQRPRPCLLLAKSAH